MAGGGEQRLALDAVIQQELVLACEIVAQLKAAAVDVRVAAVSRNPTIRIRISINQFKILVIVNLLHTGVVPQVRVAQRQGQSGVGLRLFGGIHVLAVARSPEALGQRGSHLQLAGKAAGLDQAQLREVGAHALDLAQQALVRTHLHDQRVLRQTLQRLLEVHRTHDVAGVEVRVKHQLGLAAGDREVGAGGHERGRNLFTLAVQDARELLREEVVVAHQVRRVVGDLVGGDVSPEQIGVALLQMRLQASDLLSSTADGLALGRVVARDTSLRELQLGDRLLDRAGFEAHGHHDAVEVEQQLAFLGAQVLRRHLGGVLHVVEEELPLVGGLRRSGGRGFGASDGLRDGGAVNGRDGTVAQ